MACKKGFSACVSDCQRNNTCKNCTLYCGEECFLEQEENPDPKKPRRRIGRVVSATRSEEMPTQAGKSGKGCSGKSGCGGGGCGKGACGGGGGGGRHGSPRFPPPRRDSGGCGHGRECACSDNNRGRHYDDYDDYDDDDDYDDHGDYANDCYAGRGAYRGNYGRAPRDDYIWREAVESGRVVVTPGCVGCVGCSSCGKSPWLDQQFWGFSPYTSSCCSDNFGQDNYGNLYGPTWRGGGAGGCRPLSGCGNSC